MQITATGHAGLLMETAGGRILCDPLLYPAYFASWFVFPDNADLDWATIGDCDYLYVSHLHHDHYDAENLARHVSKSATVLLPDFPIDDLEDALRESGFTNFEHIPNNTPVELDGFRLQISALTSPNDGPIGDSALAVDDGSAIVLNQNDARPLGFEALEAFAGDAGYDAHFLQFSGAIWYPMVYDLPAKTKTKVGLEKRANGLARAMRYVIDLDAAHVVPSAGPPCFLDPELFEHNDTGADPANVFPDHPAFIDYLAEHGHDKGRLLIPGSAAQITHTGGAERAAFSVTHPMSDDEVAAIFANKADYLHAYQLRQLPRIAAEKAAWPAPDVDIFGELKAWFEPLLELSVHFADGIGNPVEFRISGDPTAGEDDPRRQDESVVIDFPNRTVRRAIDGERCRYRFRVDRPLIERLIADHEIDWVNTLFLSMRFDAHRAGQYNEYLYTFFKCLIDERLEYAEGWFAERNDDDSETLLDGWAMQSRCPHLKAELAHFGVIDGTTLTCRMHGWQWDLTSGKCLTSTGHELRRRWVGDGPVPERGDGARVRIAPRGAPGEAGAGDDIPDMETNA